jgi:hypothetical protein
MLSGQSDSGDNQFIRQNHMLPFSSRVSALQLLVRGFWNKRKQSYMKMFLNQL